MATGDRYRASSCAAGRRSQVKHGRLPAWLEAAREAAAGRTKRRPPRVEAGGGQLRRARRYPGGQISGRLVLYYFISFHFIIVPRRILAKWTARPESRAAIRRSPFANRDIDWPEQRGVNWNPMLARARARRPEDVCCRSSAKLD